MALPLVPFALGVAAGSLATFFYKDSQAREALSKTVDDVRKSIVYAAEAIAEAVRQERSPREEGPFEVQETHPSEPVTGPAPESTAEPEAKGAGSEHEPRDESLH